MLILLIIIWLIFGYLGVALIANAEDVVPPMPLGIILTLAGLVMFGIGVMVWFINWFIDTELKFKNPWNWAVKKVKKGK